MEEINPNFLPIILNLVKIKVQSRYSLVMDKPLTWMGLSPNVQKIKFKSFDFFEKEIQIQDIK